MFAVSQTEQSETIISMKQHRLNNEAYINQSMQLAQNSDDAFAISILQSEVKFYIEEQKIWNDYVSQETDINFNK